MKKIILITSALCLMCVMTNAQGWDDTGSDDSWGSDDGTSDDGWGTDDGASDDGSYDYDPGSGASVPSGSDSASDDGWGDSDDSWGGGSDDGGSSYGGEEYVRSGRPKVEAKPYVRFTGMPYDSVAQLVTYVEIVEVIVPDRFLDLGGEDYSVSDSLYARALVWMNKQFGKKEAKKMIEESGIDPSGKEGNTIKAFVTMPLVAQINKYSKTEVGTIEFEMELRFKDERYRYRFDNFVHVSASRSGGAKADRTYMEYYVTAKKNIRATDKILMACNNQMNRMIEDLRNTCSETPYIDDDDW